eukprot:814402-Rhodomonas_salina.1
MHKLKADKGHSRIFKTELKRWRKKYLYKSKFTANQTVLAMEVHGLSHRNIDGLCDLSPRALFHCHSAICNARKELIRQALVHQLCCDLPRGYGTDLSPVLLLAFQLWLSEHPDHPLAQQDSGMADL